MLLRDVEVVEEAGETYVYIIGNNRVFSLELSQLLTIYRSECFIIHYEYYITVINKFFG